MTGIQKITYGILAAAIMLALVHMELGAVSRNVPEQILVQVYASEGYPETQARCFADVFAGDTEVRKKPLRPLASVYDVLESRTFFTNVEQGFYLLETGLPRTATDFEIRIVCYTPGMEGVSHTIVTSDGSAACDIRSAGRVLVC